MIRFDLNPMSRHDNEQTNNLSRNMKKGDVTKNQWLTTEMVSRHAFEVATQNAVESKTARLRHRIIKGPEKCGRNKDQHSWQQ